MIKKILLVCFKDIILKGEIARNILVCSWNSKCGMKFTLITTHHKGILIIVRFINLFTGIRGKAKYV